MSEPIVVLGDAMLDRDVDGAVDRIAPDAPVPVLDERSAVARPGGAALAAALVARHGIETVLVTALGADAAAAELLELLAAHSVHVVQAGTTAATPEKIRLRSEGHALLRLDRADHGSRWAEAARLTAEVREALASAAGVLVADYGRGIAAAPGLRRHLAALTVPRVWDPHPPGPAPVRGARLVTPNLSELAGAGRHSDLRQLVALAERARRRWGAGGVALSLGARGACYVAGNGVPLAVPARPVTGGDACGAGDCFAASATVALTPRGALASEAVVEAVREASDFVEGGGATTFGPPGSGGSGARSTGQLGAGQLGPGQLARGQLGADELVARVRAEGGRVVATGGCFEVLHAGHLASLQAARQLGDCLVVCLNSDASVRALKGPGRPVVGEADRAAALLALSCVDAVVVFDEPSPAQVLSRLRPAIFAKGADYGGAALPEQAVLDAWGGQCVTLPYVAGYSTTRLVGRALAR